MATPADYTNAKWLRLSRERLGLSQGQFARLINTGDRTVRQWEAEDVLNSRSPNPIAVRAVMWMLDGFRPSDWPTKTKEVASMAVFSFLAKGPASWTFDYKRSVEHGNQALKHATEIAAGGILAARQYAEDWHAFYRPDHWLRADAPKRAQMVANMAKDALISAKVVVEKGKSHWTHIQVDGSKTLCVASLLPDGSAGHVGFLPIAQLDKTGKAFVKSGQ